MLGNQLLAVSYFHGKGTCPDANGQDLRYDPKRSGTTCTTARPHASPLHSL